MGIRKIILQKFANLIISILESEQNQEMFDFYLKIGFQIDTHAVSYGIYLD